MKSKRAVALLLTSGLLLSLGSCASDVGYYLLNALSDSLPTLLTSLIGTTTA